jgi:hypothetical protein
VRKQEREEVERREQVERERLRRKAGNEIVHIREKIENEERVRAAQEMRRDRAEREEHRQKILDEIKRDRERMKKASASSADSKPEVVKAVHQPATSSVSTSGVVTYDTCRLAIRLPDGTSLMQTFQANEQLCAVRLYIQLNRKDLEVEAARVSRFNLLMPPCQTFSDEDMEQSLRDLGLCPSARLTITDLK